VKLAVPKDKDTVTIHLVAGAAGDGREHDVVVWENPRLVAAGKADLPLAMVQPMARMLAAGRDPAVFGLHPQGLTVGAGDLCLQAKDRTVNGTFAIDSRVTVCR